MTSKPDFSTRASGDGYELLDANGEVIAWTLDEQWAWRILMALDSTEAPTTAKGRDQQ